MKGDDVAKLYVCGWRATSNFPTPANPHGQTLFPEAELRDRPTRNNQPISFNSQPLPLFQPSSQRHINPPDPLTLIPARPRDSSFCLLSLDKSRLSPFTNYGLPGINFKLAT